jgi:hypothetical protein
MLNSFDVKHSGMFLEEFELQFVYDSVKQGYINCRAEWTNGKYGKFS